MGIENIIGSQGNDTILGDDVDNHFSGEDGNDSLVGGAGNDTLDGGWGSDTLDGGDGIDTADFSFASEGYKFDLPNETVNKANGSVNDEERIVGIENIIGSQGNDTILGDDVDNHFSGGSGNDILDGGLGHDVARYQGKAEGFNRTLNDDGTWTIKDIDLSDGNEGTDTLTNIDQIHFNSDNTLQTNDSQRNTVYGVAGVHENREDTSHAISGGDAKATNFIIDIEGSTGLGLDFDTTKLANFVNDISLPDQDIENARLAANIVYDVAGGAAGAIPVLGDFLSTRYAVEQTLINYQLDLAQVEAQKQAAIDAVNNPEYNTSAWGSITQTNRDLLVIEDFQIGVDNIFLPSVETVSNVGYAIKSGTLNSDDGVWIEAQIGDENANLAFIVDNYGNKSNTEFADEITNLLKGPVITTFNQTPIDVNPSSVGQVQQKGTYANDHIYGLELTNSTFQGTVGSFELVGEFGDDLLQGNEGNDYLWGGFNTTEIPPFTAFTYEDDGFDILQGGQGDDLLNGGSGNDFLDGGGLIYDDSINVAGVITNDGTDTLTGGSGNDTFVFNTLSTGIDTITDFEVLIDTIQIDQSQFGASSNSQFFFDDTNGALSFEDQQFATLSNYATLDGFDVSRDIELV